MKARLYSATLLLIVLTTTVFLDQTFTVAWFSALLLAVTLCLGTSECYTLFRLKDQLCAPHVAPATRRNLRAAFLAAACIGLPGVFLFALLFQEQGLFALFYLVSVAKMVDNGGLFVGRLFGRHKLAPKISPGKTVEGVLGGLCTGVLTAFLLGPFCTKGTPLFFLFFGLTISLLAILGDLAESLMKRRAGVKNSGALLPGIGGILDLIDSVLLPAPVAYVLLVLC